MRHRLEEDVSEFIRRHGLFTAAERILLAVSGGADSIALLHILVSLKTEGLLSAEFVCAHVNHKLRGPFSNEDERFVVQQARHLGLAIVTQTVDVRAYAKANRLSLETAGRQLRLARLQEMARARGCTWVATGHQRNDNAETVLQRLCRGTGLRGLAGIRPRRPFGDGLWLARPLLGATRAEIAAYLRQRRLPWREDHTNVDLTYTRNAIRHRLLPTLQQEARRSLVDELSELAASTAKLYDRIERQAEQAWSSLATAASAEVRIHAPALALLAEPVAVELIRRALARLGCGERHMMQQHYRDVLQLAGCGREGKRVSLPQGFIARREREQILLRAGPTTTARPAGPAPSQHVPRAAPHVPQRAAVTLLQIPGKTSFAGYEIDADILDSRPAEATRAKSRGNDFREYLDLDRVCPPVVVRARQAGDRFQPLGLAGAARVGKFLTAAKVRPELRERVVILSDREKILWVCPVRISERAKVTPATRRILSLTIRTGA